MDRASCDQRALKAALDVREIDPGLAGQLLALAGGEDRETMLSLTARAESKVAHYIERLHPRDRHGRWAHKPGGGAGAATVGGSNGRQYEQARQVSTPARGARGSGGERRHHLVHLAQVDASTQAGYERYVAAVRANPHAEFVTLPSREELGAKRVWLSDDGKVGVTVSPDGEVGNLFANPGAPPGAGGEALDYAVAHGGTWLDCFDGYLPTLYHRHGFREVARVKFDPAQEPAGWDEPTQDHPDIVFMGVGAPATPAATYTDWPSAELAAISAGASNASKRREAQSARSGGGLTQSITLPKSGKMRKPAQHTLGVIDKLIDVPPLEEPIPLRVTSGTNKLGAYGRKTIDGRMVPQFIRLSTREHPQLSFAHELGHLTDEQHLGTEVTHKGVVKPIWGSFLAAARHQQREQHDTSSIAELQNAIDTQPHAQEWDEWYQAIRDSPEYEKLRYASIMQYATHKYLTEPPELFARSFSQWVATRSRDRKLMEELQAELDEEQIAAHMKPRTVWHNFREDKRPATVKDIPDSLRYRQWTPESFDRIGKALDKLMAAYGMTPPSKTKSFLTGGPIRSSRPGTRSETFPESGDPESKSRAWRERLHPRDRHGRWAHSPGGHGTSGVHALQAPAENQRPSGQLGWEFNDPRRGLRVGDSAEILTNYSDRDRDHVQRAVDDAIRRSPELLSGPRPLRGVGYVTGSQPPPDVDPNAWGETRDFVYREHPAAVTYHDSTGEDIMINDEKAVPPASEIEGFLSPATATPEGIVTHEIGHAWFHAHGVSDQQEAGDMLDFLGIGPRDIAEMGSRYGASDPMEGLAELYAMYYSPGYGLPSDLRTKFERLQQLARDLAAEKIGPDANSHLPLVADSTPELQDAIDRNLKANAWVATNPALDAWEQEIRRIEMHKAAGFLMETKRYDPRERRDWHGRWSAGGGLLGLRVPRGGPNNIAGLDEEQVVQRLSDTFDRNDTATEDAAWYETVHNQTEAWCDVLNAGVPKEDHVDPQTFAAVVAATSANNLWSGKERAGGRRPYPNLRTAARCVLRYRRYKDAAQHDPAGLAEELNDAKDLGGMPSVMTAGWKILSGESPDKVLGGPKVRSFYNDLCWPGKTDSVAIDRWAARAISGEHGPEFPIADGEIIRTSRGYLWAAEMYRKATDSINQRLGIDLSPDAVQAVVWTQWQREGIRPPRKKRSKS